MNGSNRFALDITPGAQKGINKIRRSGAKGILKQVEKALNNLAENPAHPSLHTHRMKPEPRFGTRGGTSVPGTYRLSPQRTAGARRVPG